MLKAMGRPARIPPQLARGPFTLADAQRAGLKRWHLEGASWRRLGPSIYAWAGNRETPELRLAAACHRLPPAFAFSGLTAAWLHGLDVEPCDPIEVTVEKREGVSGRTGIVVRRSELAAREVVSLRGYKATSIIRTLKDLCSRLSLTEAVVLADAALHRGLVSIDTLDRAIRAYGGLPGVANFRRVLAYAEPAAESPMETRLRMLLVLAGPPRPVAQVPVHDRLGRFVGRPDLLYRECKLGLEYDGATHRASLAEDNRRQNRLLDAGISLLRFTANDIYQTPQSVVDLVRARVEARGARAGTRGFEHPPRGANAGAGGLLSDRRV